MHDRSLVRRFEELSSGDVGDVGGKNASLGEMIRHLRDEGIRVPSGFATTAEAYWRYLEHNDLADRMRGRLEGVDRVLRGPPLDVAHEHGRTVGICGQAPSDHPDFAEFLVDMGIDSISVNPDSVLSVIEYVAKAQREGGS